MGKTKWLKDAVHGYIKFDEAYFFRIIDTPHFQRLRRVEQTSMRMLYPSARHDRFAHSIGVFALGEKAFSYFQENVKNLGLKVFIDRDEELKNTSNAFRLKLKSFKSIYSECLLKNNKYWKERKLNFLLACLLHDVGHAPFSHNLEDFYIQEKGLRDAKDIMMLDDDEKIKTRPYIEYALWKSLKERTNQDTANQLLKDHSRLPKDAPTPAPHEIVSATVLLDCFHDEIPGLFDNLKIAKETLDFDFMVRCITGITYKTSSNVDTFTLQDIRRRMDNCLIRLLNGKSFDVDKLDYLLRDNVTAGIESSKIDVDRLLSALTIRIIENGDDDIFCITPAINKSAVSIVQNMCNASDGLYLWTYGHHKTAYFFHLLKLVILQLNKLNRGQDSIKDRYIENLFSIERIENDFFCDDDIWVELKKFRNEIWEADEWMKHGSSYVSLWKSYAELNDALSAARISNDTNLLNRIAQKIKLENSEQFAKELIKNGFEEELYESGDDLRAKPKIIFAPASAKELVWDLPVRMPNGRYINFTALMNPETTAMGRQNKTLFYVYVKKDWYQKNTEKLRPAEMLKMIKHQTTYA